MPFHQPGQDFRVMFAVEKGKRPSRPSTEICQMSGLDDGIWQLIESCWHQSPTERPSATTIASLLRSRIGPDRDQRPPGGWDDEFIMQLRSDPSCRINLTDE